MVEYDKSYLQGENSTNVTTLRVLGHVRKLHATHEEILKCGLDGTSPSHVIGQSSPSPVIGPH